MTDFHKAMQDATTSYELQEQALADARARIAYLESQPTADSDKPPQETLPPLPFYDTYEDFCAVGWQRYPDLDIVKSKFNDEWMRHGLIGTPWPPIMHVVIGTLGNLSNVELRPLNVQQMLDYDAICNRRCVDVTAEKNRTAAIVQPGDGSYETDVADMEALCQNYQGGIRTPLSQWPAHMQHYAQILAEARPDLAG